MKFKAYAVTNEIDLNKIAARCGIPKKYTWEEPLILQGETLEKILEHSPVPHQMVFIFAFGSVVFINTPPPDEKIVIEYLKTIRPDINANNFERYNDDYELRASSDTAEDPGEELTFTDQYAIVPQIEAFHPELISIVIAKSVALEKTEEQMEKILDLLEGMIDRLEKAKLKISDRELAETTAKIIRHEYNTIAYIMILDKPDITWSHSDAALFYDKMSDFFELNDRYVILKQKTDILNIILDNFSSISHSTRGLFIEWLIVILILVEIILMVVDLLK
ncbi:MAG TPA: RMD1 family protein [Bacillota bacterium]|nr:RMD1 family protein [Bacillota bacterium]